MDYEGAAEHAQQQAQPDDSWPMSFSTSISYLAALQRKTDPHDHPHMPKPLPGRDVHTPDIRHRTGLSPLMPQKAQSFIAVRYPVPSTNNRYGYGAVQTQAEVQVQVQVQVQAPALVPVPASFHSALPTLDEHAEFVSKHHGSGFMTSVFNSTNMLMGVGILALPFALRMSGWLGLVGLLGMTGVTSYTAHLLGRCMHRTHSRSYPDIAGVLMGHRWKAVVAVALYSELFMFTALFIVLMGTNLAHIFPRFSVKLCMVTAFVFLLPVINLRDLAVLSYISAIGMASTLMLVFVIVTSSAGRLGDVLATRIAPADTNIVLPHTFGLAFGMFSSAFSGHGVFPSIYDAMEQKSQYPAVMYFTFAVVSVCYTTVAIMGYIAFGSDAAEEVTLNLPSGGFYGCVLWLCVLTAYTKYTLNLHPLAEGIAELLPAAKSKAMVIFKNAAVRICAGLASLCVAVALPSFGYLCVLMGSVITVLVSIVFPVLLYAKCYSDVLTVADYVCMAVSLLSALVCAVYGLYGAFIGVGGG